ncbi:MAG: flagellin, partial [Aeoliella sp.]
ADSLRVEGQVAKLLGFFATGDTEATSATGSLAASDRHTLEVDSTFNTLMRLREALVNEDFPAIGREIGRIDNDLDRVNFARAELGARLQSLQSLQHRHEDEEVALRNALSQEIDVDLAEAISEFTSRQFALQASLQTSANLLQMSILNFI